jgi:hypothetical protein
MKIVVDKLPESVRSLVFVDKEFNVPMAEHLLRGLVTKWNRNYDWVSLEFIDCEIPDACWKVSYSENIYLLSSSLFYLPSYPGLQISFAACIFSFSLQYHFKYSQFHF